MPATRLANVAQVLDVIDALDRLAERIAAIPVDLTELLDDIAAAREGQNAIVGAAVYPADAAESTVVIRNGKEHRFSRATKQLEPVVAVPADEVLLYEPATAAEIVAGEPVERP
jgi:hypothetical protein